MALHVPQIAGRAARALPRFSDIVVADVGKYRSKSSLSVNQVDMPAYNSHGNCMYTA